MSHFSTTSYGSVLLDPDLDPHLDPGNDIAERINTEGVAVESWLPGLWLAAVRMPLSA
jgi:hypothetical protein